MSVYRAFLLALFCWPMIGPAPAVAADAPLVIAHRGASAERPEHTLAAYERAIAQGADFIEPDLVLTKDGALVVRHENEISGTTDVADHPEFADRKATKTIDGQVLTGWFTEDFTLAELRTLRARERLPQLRPDNAAFDGLYTVPTFEEVLRLVRAAETQSGRTIGVYPETKHPTYFASLGLSFDDALLSLLGKYGYRGAEDAVFIQSFEVDNLKRLHQRTTLRLIQLVDSEGGPADHASTDRLSYADMVSPEGLRAVAAYASGLGPALVMILPVDETGRLQAATTLVADAHAAGLKVHPWTLRPENYFLPLDFRKGTDPAVHGDVEAYAKRLFEQGIDGLFSDDPKAAVTALGAR